MFLPLNECDNSSSIMVQCKYLFDFVSSKEPKQKSFVAVRVCIHARQLRKVKFIPRTDGAQTHYSFFLTTRVLSYESGISKANAWVLFYTSRSLKLWLNLLISGVSSLLVHLLCRRHYRIKLLCVFKRNRKTNVKTSVSRRPEAQNTNMLDFPHKCAYCSIFCN